MRSLLLIYINTTKYDCKSKTENYILILGNTKEEENNAFNKFSARWPSYGCDDRRN